MNYDIYIDNFDKNNYVIVKDFFDQHDVDRMVNRSQFLLHSGIMTKDAQCSSSYSIYGDMVHSEMQEKYRLKLELYTGINLYPTYTYMRWYQPKEVLKYHTDRPSCEISLTSTLCYDTFDDKPWLIFVEGSEGDKKSVKSTIVDEKSGTEIIKYGVPYELYPRDVLIYKGENIAHWREKFIGISQAQIFMHYVNKNGKYHECKYDFRPNLGSSISKKDTQKQIDFEQRLK